MLLPGIEDDKQVFLQMVNRYLGSGLKGLIVAVLVAAVVSTLNSGLNSFSTIYTLDIHQRWFSNNRSEHHVKNVGRVTTLLAGLMAVGIAVYLKRAQEIGGLNLFDLFQSIIGYMAPPVSVVFVLGIFWKRATALAALITLLFGSMLCLGIGIANFHQASFLLNEEGKNMLPHFLFQSFLLFCLLMAIMIGASLASTHSTHETALPTLRQAYQQHKGLGRIAVVGWTILAVIMVSLYVFFQLLV